jgi:RNA polymerase sigma-70 factor (ECF subfamily)
MPNQIHTLIESCKKGNQLAQMQVYDQYAQAMFTVACRYLEDTEEAKDAMQEGFLKAFLNIDKYEPTATFGAWLKRIIINQCLDTLKKRRLDMVDNTVDILQVIDDENWEFDSAISKADILVAIERLKAKYKIVIQLYLIEGYDHEEISEILNIPVKTSRTQLSRGKQKLRELLNPQYNEARY